MRLEVLLPSRILIRRSDVRSVVAETAEGSFGLLPRRLDCVAALVPGILSYATDEGESFVAVDEGILVKTGPTVRVAVRRAIAGADLKDLRDAVEHEFRSRDEQTRELRASLNKLEAGFLSRLAEFRND